MRPLGVVRATVSAAEGRRGLIIVRPDAEIEESLTDRAGIVVFHLETDPQNQIAVREGSLRKRALVESAGCTCRFDLNRATRDRIVVEIEDCRVEIEIARGAATGPNPDVTGVSAK